MDQLVINDYYNTDSLFYSKSYEPGLNQLVISDNGLSIDDIDYFEPGYLEIMFQISNLCTVYHRYPDSLIMGLSRIGGLFFFLSVVGAFLYFGHLVYFQSQLAKEFKKAMQKEPFADFKIEKQVNNYIN